MPNLVPEILAKGTINEESDATGYFVMPKLDVDFTTYLESYSGIERSYKVSLVIL